MRELVSAQIIIESLPVSSSGHCLLIEKLTGCTSFCSRELTWASHAPTVLIMAVLFYDRWIPFLRHPQRTWHLLLRFIWYGLCAELGTISLYGILSYWSVTWHLAVGFTITALLLLSDRYIPCNEYEKMTWWRACAIGCAQGVSCMPGVSRMASTYSMGRALGIAPRHAFTWACALAVPPFVLASFYGIVREWGQIVFLYGTPSGFLMLAAATVMGYLLMWLVRCAVTQGTLWRLSWYMLLPLALSLF